MTATDDGSDPALEEPGPRPHRCNARVEDLIQALFTGEFSKKAGPAWSVMWRCIRSEIGQEPTDAYQVLTDPEKYLKPMRRKRVEPQPPQPPR